MLSKLSETLVEIYFHRKIKWNTINYNNEEVVIFCENYNGIYNE